MSEVLEAKSPVREKGAISTGKPKWLRVKLPTGQNYKKVRGLVQNYDLHTICESGNCPNMGECWGEGTATFMILGNVCTRSCGFCAVATGRPDTVDWDEPERGFNEWTFFSPAYGTLRSELRYMLGSYDYLSAFADLGFAERQAQKRGLWDRHSGIGLGLNFQTKGGIFSLFLAVGQSNSDSYDFRAGKIHLAYVNRF